MFAGDEAHRPGNGDGGGGRLENPIRSASRTVGIRPHRQIGADADIAEGDRIDVLKRGVAARRDIHSPAKIGVQRGGAIGAARGDHVARCGAERRIPGDVQKIGEGAVRIGDSRRPRPRQINGDVPRGERARIQILIRKLRDIARRGGER